MWSKYLIFLLSMTKTLQKPVKEETTCGFHKCHPVKRNVINVHLVSHTHDDVGWTKTEEKYYNGQVKYIIQSVISSLEKDVNRRFIYVETAYFWEWWLNQKHHVKNLVKRFVKEGRLEFVGGAWSMNDEATTHYQSIIDQFTWGLRRLNDTFGECGRPTVGWQIDPFGHSREMAAIFAQLGFDGLLLGRIDYQDIKTRFHNKTTEMIWKGSDELGAAGDIFTGVLYNIYKPPDGFCFDKYCDDPEICDEESCDVNEDFLSRGKTENNVDERLDDFFIQVNNVAKKYATKNILMTMGNDFHYEKAEKWFRNLDKLIKYGNKRNGTKYNIIYSTPSCYVKAVHDEAADKKLLWKTKTDDFFPYASGKFSYWTGYFTSRPTIKRFERIGNNFLQICKQLYSVSNLNSEYEVELNILREAMGVMQHHDAITGTEKEHVAHDYAALLSEGMENCNIIVSEALKKLTTKTSSKMFPNNSFSSCLLTNISSCSITEKSSKFVVTVYNPLSRLLDKQFVRFPVLGQAYKVTDFEGHEVQSQLLPLPPYVLNIPGRESNATSDLVFEAKNIPPLGFKSFFVEKENKYYVTQPESTFIHEHGDIKLERNETTGLLKRITIENRTIPLKQEFLYYEGHASADVGFIDQNSGAYIFRPIKQQAKKVAQTINSTVYNGYLLIEIQQTFSNWLGQTVRLYKNEKFIEFEWIVGPIPHKRYGKEIISRFTTNLKTNSTFFTDSNGRQLMKRIRNYRPTWKLKTVEPTSSNYYPVTSRILMRDESENMEVAVLTDRAQGGSSLADGQIELMVHRSCIRDDSFGVEEPLMETAFGVGLVAKGSHYLVFGNIKDENSKVSLAAYERDLAQRKLLSAWTFFTETQDISFEDYNNAFKMQFAGLRKSLPKNIQILTLEPWKNGDTLLRLEHVFQKNEDFELSKPVTLDLKELFSTFEVYEIQETTLGGNQWLKDNERLQFQVKTDDETSERNILEETSVHSITLAPMQIRTFIIKAEHYL